MTRSDEVSPVYKTGDYTYQSPRIDQSTHAQTIIEYEHHETHAGSHYNYCDYQLTNASAATVKFVVTTPNTTTWAHLVFQITSSAGATVELYEGSSSISGGSSITPRNNNRNSSNTSAFTILKDPTVSTVGTRSAGFIAGGTRAGGIISRSMEKVLKQNTSYYILITSLANSNDISWCFEWYEHSNKTA